MGINVNGVAPGPFLTDMNIPFQHSEHAMRVLNHEVAMRRCGKLHEIQGPVLFLASDCRELHNRRRPPPWTPAGPPTDKGSPTKRFGAQEPMKRELVPFVRHFMEGDVARV